MSKKSFEHLLSAVNKAKSYNSSSNDDNTWKCEKDSAGTGFAIIRFLPGATDDVVPFAKKYNHGFKNSLGKWFIEDCRTTFGEQCPVCEANSELWNTGSEKNKQIARDRRRKLSYYSNILIISDPKNPDNEGKTFIFRYGKNIFDKIVEALDPEVVEGDEPKEAFNPFSLSEGANFKLRIRKVDGQVNYDKSEFSSPSAIDTEIDFSSLYDLSKIIDPSATPPYDVIKQKFDKHLGVAQARKTDEEKDDEEFEKSVIRNKDKETPKAPAAPAAQAANEDDDDISFFKKLAADDDDDGIPY